MVGEANNFDVPYAMRVPPFVGDTPLGKTYSSAVLDNFTSA